MTFFIFVMAGIIVIFGTGVAFMFRKNGIYNPEMPSTDNLDEVPAPPFVPASPPEALVRPVEPVLAPEAPILPLLWDTPQNARHSVRVIADSEGLTFEQKNTMCATIGGESGWITTATNKNKNSKGVITSTDWGICQWNDRYHGTEITPDEAVHNPEKAVRLMCQYWKRGQRNLWMAYVNNSYKRFLA